MNKITLSISGMHCASCAKIIKMELDDLTGIVQAEVDEAKKEAVISFDPAKTSQDKISEVIKNLGYEVVKAW